MDCSSEHEQKKRNKIRNAKEAQATPLFSTERRKTKRYRRRYDEQKTIHEDAIQSNIIIRYRSTF